MGIQIEKKSFTVDKFIVEGNIFDTKKAAEKFAKKLEKLIEREYYLVSVKPDLTEGRGFYGKIILSLPKYTTVNSAYQYLVKTYGEPISMIQGTSPMPTYVLSEEKSFEDFIELQKFLEEERQKGLGTDKEKQQLIHLDEAGKDITTEMEE